MTRLGAPERQDDRMIHPKLAELRKWEPAEYAAGYNARFAEASLSDAANYCWRAGWDDADMEMMESERHNKILAEGGEDNFHGTWMFLVDAGGDARVNGIPFDGERTKPWKEGWIDTDINLGERGEERS